MGCERQSSIAEREHFQYLRRDELMEQAVVAGAPLSCLQPDHLDAVSSHLHGPLGLPSSQRQNGEFADLNDQRMLRLAARDGEPGRDERLRVGASHQGDACLRQTWLAVV